MTSSDYRTECSGTFLGRVMYTCVHSVSIPLQHNVYYIDRLSKAFLTWVMPLNIKDVFPEVKDIKA